MSTSATGFRGVFGLDIRSLALWRIGLGLLVMHDGLDRLRVLAHLTGNGALPMASVPGQRVHWSILFWNDSEPMVVAVLLLMALAGAAMAVGWRTRWASVLAWVLLVSIHARNPLMLYGGDALLRLMLFWSCFVPTNRVLSMDALAGRTPLMPALTALSPGSVGYVLQIAGLYVVTGLLKSGKPWQDGSALYWALSLDQFVDPAGVWVRERPWVYEPLTHGSWWLEVYGPLFLFVPIFFGPVRTLVVAAFVALHVGIEITMDLGVFPAMSVLCWVPLLPGWFWERTRWPMASGKSELDLWWSRMWQSLAAFGVVMTVWWNVGAVAPAWGPRPPLRKYGMMLRLDQYWDMFAPKPATRDGWYVFAGRTADDRVIDLFRDGAERTWEKPVDIPATFPAERWRKYLSVLEEDQNEPLRAPMLRTFCEDWNASAAPADRIGQLTWFWMIEDTPPPGEPMPKLRRVKLASEPCP